MKHIESELEKACVKFARSNGWDCWKNEKNGNKGIPDYSLLKSGVFLLVEFKTESGKVSHEQQRWIDRHNGNAFVVRNENEFKTLIHSV